MLSVRHVSGHYTFWLFVLILSQNAQFCARMPVGLWGVVDAFRLEFWRGRRVSDRPTQHPLRVGGCRWLVPQIHDASFLLPEQRGQPPRPELRTVRTQEGYLAERRLRTFVDDEYRHVVCYRKRRGYSSRNFAHFRLHILAAFEPTSR